MYGRIFEEIFPFLAYYRNRSRVQKRCDFPNILNLKEFAAYNTLSLEQLTGRIDEEHQRASAMDEKTFKMGLSLSVGLTIHGFMTAFLTKSKFDGMVLMLPLMLAVLGLLYLFVAGCMSFSVLRTLPKYGYGTGFLLVRLRPNARETEILAIALAQQESMNIIRHIRNESAYQALRNGFCLLLVAYVMMFLLTLGTTNELGFGLWWGTDEGVKS